MIKIPETSNRINITLLKDPIVALALGLGSGLSTIAPGTCGTLFAVVICYFMQALPIEYYFIITCAVVVGGTYASSYTINKLGVHDHPAIVIDEVAGYMISLFAVPQGWEGLLAGFLLFRFFDILKPWPISWLDKHVHGGPGVMLDDVVAGLFSLSIIQGYLYFSGYY